MNLTASNISKKYNRSKGGANWFYAVKSIDLCIEAGKLTAVYGRSGSGKTTLLNLLGGLLQPSEGKVLCGETDIYAMPDKELSAFRNQHIGIVPQGAAALGNLTVLENVLLPSLIGGRSSDEQEKRAEALLQSFGIASLRDVMPRELSGGEQRRMAIARALMNRPEILLCDEPTGDLDDENTRVVLRLLRDEAAKGTAVLLFTHEADARNYADIVMKMDGGSLEKI
ncbi:MAG: ABC transporter ATP-binding protein [Ruminococcus sp.]|nr:ABC transporter ATP-binding protein [Ruminococcus sp.]